jgi:hypothetical protein
MVLIANVCDASSETEEFVFKDDSDSGMEKIASVSEIFEKRSNR